MAKVNSFELHMDPYIYLLNIDQKETPEAMDRGKNTRHRNFVSAFLCSLIDILCSLYFENSFNNVSIIKEIH